MSEIFVSNSAQLSAALAAATGGERIVLAPGDYGNLVVSNRQFTAPVTVAASQQWASKLSGLTVANVGNLSFDGIALGRAKAADEPEWTQIGYITNSRNLVFDRVFVHGSLDNNAMNDSWGLLIDTSDGVTIKNSRFEEVVRTFIFERSANIQILNNDITKIRSDGGDFTAVDNVLIQGNRYSNFMPNGTDHPDAIQFWTNGQTRGSTNIMIRDNVMLQGSGVGTQGIFMRDENGGMPHKNVTIMNNLLYSSDQWEGISVDGVVGLKIAGNTIVSPTTDAKKFWIRVDAAQDVQITNNVVDDILVQQVTGLVMDQNLVFAKDWSQTAQLPNINAGAVATVSDLSMSGMGFQGGVPVPAPAPLPAPAPTPPPVTDIFGTSGSDTVTGTDGMNRIYGISNAALQYGLGAGTIDRLIGGLGADVFMLGDERGMFYNDGRPRTAGKGDYGQILDFQAGVDKIQLAGSVGDYIFRSETLSGLRGLAIYSDSNGNGRIDSRDELIGHVANMTSFSSDHFAFG